MSIFNKKVYADQIRTLENKQVQIIHTPPQKQIDNENHTSQNEPILWTPIFKSILRSVSYKLIDYLANKTNSIFFNIVATKLSFSNMPGYEVLIINNLLNSMNKKSLFYFIYNKQILNKCNKIIKLYSENNKINDTEYIKALEALRDLSLRNKNYTVALQASDKLLFSGLYKDEQEAVLFNREIIKAAAAKSDQEKNQLISYFLEDYNENARFISLIFAAKLFFSNNYSDIKTQQILIEKLNSGKGLEKYLGLIQQMKGNKINIGILNKNLLKGKNLGLNTITNSDLADLKHILNNIDFATDTDEINIIVNLLLNTFYKDLNSSNNLEKLTKFYYDNNKILYQYLTILNKFLK